MHRVRRRENTKAGSLSRLVERLSTQVLPRKKREAIFFFNARREMKHRCSAMGAGSQDGGGGRKRGLGGGGRKGESVEGAINKTAPESVALRLSFRSPSLSNWRESPVPLELLRPGQI